MSVADESLLVADVSNGSQSNLLAVVVYVIDQANGRIFAKTQNLHPLMQPGETHRFALTRVTTASAAPTRYYCVAQFTDDDEVSWNKYMRGALERASDGPPLLQPPGCRSW